MRTRHDKHVRGFGERVEPHVVVRSPDILGTGDLVPDQHPVVPPDAQGGQVEVDRRLASAVRVEVEHDQDDVVTAALAPGQDIGTVDLVEGQVVEPLQ